MYGPPVQVPIMLLPMIAGYSSKGPCVGGYSNNTAKFFSRCAPLTRLFFGGGGCLKGVGGMVVQPVLSIPL